MRRALLAGLIFISGSLSASAYEVDPLTRLPLSSAPVAGANRPQATAIPREIVSYSGNHAPGTIVVDTNERRMYFVLPNGQAVRYGVGVGRPGFSWAGTQTISQKREWPGWTPPPQMLKRRPDLPRHMVGGPENPLGARAMYLGSTLYRIHGSNEPETIGQAVSSGCIRMVNDDVIDLYERARVGTRVVVLR
jgi:lipoprotein-anchoring transpeptidase ErfK/SrfK